VRTPSRFWIAGILGVLLAVAVIVSALRYLGFFADLHF
jgi:hypothetical protein